MSTLAQQWEDFRAHCYSRQVLSYEQEREYRMLFYTGYYGALRELARFVEEDLSLEDQKVAVHALLMEYQQFSIAYIAERQQE